MNRILTIIFLFIPLLMYGNARRANVKMLPDGTYYDADYFIGAGDAESALSLNNYALHDLRGTLERFRGNRSIIGDNGDHIGFITDKNNDKEIIYPGDFYHAGSNNVYIEDITPINAGDSVFNIRKQPLPYKVIATNEMFPSVGEHTFQRDNLYYFNPKDIPADRVILLLDRNGYRNCKVKNFTDTTVTLDISVPDNTIITSLKYNEQYINENGYKGKDESRFRLQAGIKVPYKALSDTISIIDTSLVTEPKTQYYLDFNGEHYEGVPYMPFRNNQLEICDNFSTTIETPDGNLVDGWEFFGRARNIYLVLPQIDPGVEYTNLSYDILFNEVDGDVEFHFDQLPSNITYDENTGEWSNEHYIKRIYALPNESGRYDGKDALYIHPASATERTDALLPGCFTYASGGWMLSVDEVQKPDTLPGGYPYYRLKSSLPYGGAGTFSGGDLHQYKAKPCCFVFFDEKYPLYNAYTYWSGPWDPGTISVIRSELHNGKITHYGDPSAGSKVIFVKQRYAYNSGMVAWGVLVPHDFMEHSTLPQYRQYTFGQNSGTAYIPTIGEGFISNEKYMTIYSPMTYSENENMRVWAVDDNAMRVHNGQCYVKGKKPLTFMLTPGPIHPKTNSIMVGDILIMNNEEISIVTGVNRIGDNDHQFCEGKLTAVNESFELYNLHGIELSTVQGQNINFNKFDKDHYIESLHQADKVNDLSAGLVHSDAKGGVIGLCHGSGVFQTLMSKEKPKATFEITVSTTTDTLSWSPALTQYWTTSSGYFARTGRGANFRFSDDLGREWVWAQNGSVWCSDSTAMYMALEGYRSTACLIPDANKVGTTRKYYFTNTSETPVLAVQFDTEQVLLGNFATFYYDTLGCWPVIPIMPQEVEPGRNTNQNPNKLIYATFDDGRVKGIHVSEHKIAIRRKDDAIIESDKKKKK